ncbi:MAG: phosphoglycerate dehydrogenase [Dehalococcoidia bacterium]|nr:phosphoglycerate dehydrogenase [Dehalococcoidia bacterium]|tara:strand:+ start:12118 stop:13716 length:1599 start_codon:yes stop_codon:yes gene_type:complete
MTDGGLRPRILVADPIADEGITLLQQGADVDVRTGLPPIELREAIAEYEGLVVRSQAQVTADVLSNAGRLQVIARAGTGVDNVDLEAATERGIVVVNAPRGNTIAAAEHAFALLMSLARHIPRADRSLRGGKWTRGSFMGAELRGHTLGLVGFGPIGSEMARRALAFEMSVLVHDPFVPVERVRALGALPVELDRLYAESDFISTHTPLTASTRGMIGREQFAAMKDGVRLVNAARGGIIDEDDLLEAVRAGKVAGAALDVFTAEPPGQHPLFEEERIIVTPHLAGSTVEAQQRIAIDIAEQVLDVLGGRPPRYPVNAPLVAPETLEMVGPYLAVSELLGTVATQLLSGQLTTIDLGFFGEIAEHDVTPLKAFAIRGLLGPISEQNVNLVNASSIANSRGWAITERLHSSHEEFHNLIELRVGSSDSEITISGTASHSRPSIVRVNDLDIDLVPEAGGYLLVCENEDRPGMIGQLGTLLGGHDINISAMRVGRSSPRGRALMVLMLDDEPAAASLDAIAAGEGIASVRLVRL